MTKIIKENFRKVDQSRRCVDCGQPLKVNLLAKNPKAERCYVCTKLASNTLNINRKRLAEKQRKLKQTYHLI